MTYCELIANYFDSPGWVFTFAFIAILSLLLVLIKSHRYSMLLAERASKEHLSSRCPSFGNTGTLPRAAKTYLAERKRLEMAAEKDKELDILASKIAEKIKGLNSGV